MALAVHFIVAKLFKVFDNLACTNTFMLNELGKENIHFLCALANVYPYNIYSSQY